MAQPAVALERERYERSTILDWLTTVDHKKIGKLYLFSALAFFAIGGILALLIRTQLATPNGTLLGPDTYNQVFTMHGTIMIFLAVMPLNTAFFNFMIPLMIGARDVAFPRLNAFSYWTFLLGALLLLSSFAFGAAPNAGWFGYANLTSARYSPGLNVDFWTVGLQVLGVASLASALNFFVTIVNMRAPGMSLMRMPIFVWMTLITSVLMLLAFPSLTIGVFELIFDRNFGTLFFDPTAGGDVVLWQHLFWIFGHPEVYILILPPMAMISEILPTFSRKPLFGYPFVVYSGIAIAFLSFGVWAHHMFAVGLGPVANSVFATTTMLIAIPTGVKIFNWLGTLWGGSIRLTTAMLFAVSFIGMFTIGGLSGVMHASVPVDYWQTDSYFVVAHFHYVLFGGAMLAIFGAIYYWFPKMFGRVLDERLGKIHFHYVLFGGAMLAIFGAIYYWFPKMFGRVLDERLGKIHFWSMLVGFNLTFFPMHFLGVDGMPRRIYTYPEGMGWDLWNMVETVGAFILAVSVVVFAVNVLKTFLSKEVAAADPWDGRTLEWSLPSPPPVYNFAVIPTVQTRDAFWEEKHGSGASVETATNTNPPASLVRNIHMPNPSFAPLITSIGLVIMGAGLLTTPIVIGIGVAVLIFGLFVWSLEPNEPAEPGVTAERPTVQSRG